MGHRVLARDHPSLNILETSWEFVGRLHNKFICSIFVTKNVFTHRSQLHPFVAQIDTESRLIFHGLVGVDRQNSGLRKDTVDNVDVVIRLQALEF